MSPDREFYVGYQAKAPPGLARRTRIVVAALVIAAIATAVAIVGLQKPFEPGIFEFGVIKDFEGWIIASPVPSLLVTDDEQESTRGTFDRYLLVSPGKHSATPLIEDYIGQRVRLQGSLIHRDGHKMIEVRPGSVEFLPESATTGAPESTSTVVARITLTGEIVDSKCFLGVMKPGREKTHRSCAARCISGGIPPLLATTTLDGEEVNYLLVDSQGRPVNQFVLDYVAEPVAISGEIRRREGERFFYADLATIERTSE